MTGQHRSGYIQRTNLKEDKMTETPPEPPDVGPEGPNDDPAETTEPDGGSVEEAPPPA